MRDPHTASRARPHRERTLKRVPVVHQAARALKRPGEDAVRHQDVTCDEDEIETTIANAIALFETSHLPDPKMRLGNTYLQDESFEDNKIK